MAHRSTYRGIEFVCEESDVPKLHAWYDNLREDEVKKSVTKIKCSDYRPYDQANFRLIVLCNHPFSNPALGMNIDDDGTLIKCRLEALVPEFANWIERNSMPVEAVIGDRYACIDWWPKELADHVLNDLSPQNQAQWEMDSHRLDCLELIRLASVSDQEFNELWRGSNEPFFAAGRLILGEFQWIREVPFDYLRSESDGEMLLERVGDYAREFVGLSRLALLAGAESALLDRALVAIRRFNAEYLKEIPRWLDLAHYLLDETEQIGSSVSNSSSEYVKIDKACDQLRRDLVGGTRGLEDEVIAVINAVLPTLDAPQTSAFFTAEEDRQPT